MSISIEPFAEDDREGILALSLRAWAPVFAEMAIHVPRFVYDSFYPHGWKARQSADIEAFLSDDPEAVWVARDGAEITGWVGLRFHPQDKMGEIYILAVDPARQREGIARKLMDHAFVVAREAGMGMVMVETGGDPSHAASRATYEGAGFIRWPVARYFREI